MYYRLSTGSLFEDPKYVAVVVLVKIAIVLILLRTVDAKPVTVLDQQVWPIPSRGLIVLVAMVTIFISLYRYMVGHSKVPTVLEGRVVEWMNGWQFSHIVFYFVIGFLFPRLWFMFFAIGVAWEGAESLLGHVSRDLDWWKHSWLDIPLNVSGLLAGILLRAVIAPDAHRSGMGRLMSATPSPIGSRSAGLAMLVVAATSIPILMFGKYEAPVTSEDLPPRKASPPRSSAERV